MTGKLIYQRPIAEDLSGMSAIGGRPKPMGACQNGTALIVGECNPNGAAVSGTIKSCKPTGNNEALGRCKTGGTATKYNGCMMGSLY
jgi:hypothetical protein